MSWLAIHAAGRRGVRVDVGLFGIVFPVVWNRCRGGEPNLRQLEPRRRVNATSGCAPTSCRKEEEGAERGKPSSRARVRWLRFRLLANGVLEHQQSARQRPVKREFEGHCWWQARVQSKHRCPLASKQHGTEAEFNRVDQASSE